MCPINIFKNKINNIAQPRNQFIMRKSGVQSAKVICCIYSFLLSIYEVNVVNDRINILEYPEFVVIRKEFRFMMKIFYLGVSLNTLETALDKGLVEQLLEAIMNREPTEFLCNLGIRYIIGKLIKVILNNFFLIFIYFFIHFISSV